MSADHISPWLVRGVYLFGIAFILTAAIDLFTTVWPMRPTQITWRYGFLGLAGGYLQTPTLGLLLIAGGAILERNTTILRIAGISCLSLAIILLLSMGVFAMDVLQVRGLRAEEMQSTVLYGGIFQEIKYFVATCVLVLIGQGAMKTARANAADWSRRPAGIVSPTTKPVGTARRAPVSAAPDPEPDLEG